MTVIAPKPSSALIMKSDSTVAECVRAMRDHGYGAILISEGSSDLPCGIFTERDLLKWVDEIEKGVAWNQPISSLMSKPVLTISIDELGAAPRIMAERGFRHLPVTHKDPTTGEVIVSMISMRDILHTLVQSGRFAKTDLLRTIRVGAMVKSNGFRQLLRNMCAERGNATLREIAFDLEDKSRDVAIAQVDYLIFDLDFLDVSYWGKVLREFNALPRSPEVILIYDPKLHDKSELDVLTKLGLSGRFSAYMKPLNIYTLMDRLVLSC